MISLHLMKSSEVRIAGDRSNNVFFSIFPAHSSTVWLEFEQNPIGIINIIMYHFINYLLYELVIDAKN